MGNIETNTPDRPSATLGTVSRLGGAAAVLVSGLVHLQLYFDGYRDFPLDANFGRSFILQAVASVVVAIALLVTRHAAARVAGIVVLGGTLVAFALSRTDRGIFQFTEVGLNPSPQALISLLAGVIGIGLLAATFVPAVGDGMSFEARQAAVGSLVVAVVAVAASALWARSDVADEVAGPATDLTVASTAPAGTTPATSMPEMSMPGSSTPGSSVPEMSMPAPTTTAPATGAPSATDAPPVTTTADDGVTEVRIVDFAFDAPTVEVAVGTTVRWTNDDTFAHSVVADDESFRSDTMDTGDVFEFTFETAGEFPYICGIHPSMVGTITVTG